MHRYTLQAVVISLIVLSAVFAASGSAAFAEAAYPSYFDSYNKISPISMVPYYQDTNLQNESSESFLDDFDMGTAHKIVGYSALGAGAAAGVTGYLVAKKYDDGKNPSRTLSAFHSATSVGSIGLGVSAAVTGYIAYSGLINFKNGITTYNTHLVLGTLSALGFIAAAAFVPEGQEGQGLKKGSYSTHCNIAKVSGITMFATVLVIQF